MTHGIGHVYEHDWHTTRRRRNGLNSGEAVGQDDVRGKRKQFRRIFAIALGIARAPSSIDPQVPADGPPQLLKALRERQEAGLSFTSSAVKGINTPTRRIRRAAAPVPLSGEAPKRQRRRGQ